MINRDKAVGYNVNVKVREDRSVETVHLGLVAEREYATLLTRADAKRVAYALLLAADGHEPAVGDGD